MRSGAFFTGENLLLADFMEAGEAFGCGGKNAH
jgi:hypothetical protein